MSVVFVRDTGSRRFMFMVFYNEWSVKYSTFEATADDWGSIGIAYPSDTHMLIGAYSSDYLLAPGTS